MQGDHHIGRGWRERNLKFSVFSANRLKWQYNGRAETVRRNEDTLRKSDELRTMLPQLSGARLVCHCRADQACHADSTITVNRETVPGAYNRDGATAAAAPSADG